MCVVFQGFSGFEGVSCIYYLTGFYINAEMFTLQAFFSCLHADFSI